MKKSTLTWIIIGVVFFIFILCASMYIILHKKVKIEEKEIEVKSTYNNPIVPEGFKKVETQSASWEIENGIPKGWNNGLVIEDEIGNQFVWVPKVALTNENIIKNYQYSKQEQNKNQLEEQLKKYNEQIEKYGGFYISRYEAGVSDEMQKNTTNISSRNQ